MEHFLENLGFRVPALRLKGGTRSVIRLEGILPEAAPVVACALVDFDEHVGFMVYGSPELKVIVFLFVRLAASTLNMATASDTPLVRKHIHLRVD